MNYKLIFIIFLFLFISNCEQLPKDKIDKVNFFLKDSNLDFFILGKTNASNNLNLTDITTISISSLKKLYERTLPLIMGEHK